MQRISMGLAVLTGLATLASALVIRAELAFPGLQIFSAEGAAYTHIVLLHGAAGYAFAAACIALAAFVAAPAWGPARLIGWPALLAAIPALGLAGYGAALAFGMPAAQAGIPGADIFTRATSPGDFGTTFFDPSGTEAPHYGFDPLHIPFGLMAGMQLAALALIAARTGLRRTALACAALVLLCTAGIAALLAAPVPTLVLPLLIISVLAVLAPLAIELVDSDGPAAPFLLTSVLLTVVFATVLAATDYGWPRPWGLGGTQSETATIHVISLMAPFLLIAGLNARRAAPLAGLGSWIGAGCLALATVLAYAPYVILGRQGMPAGYPDYPASFAPRNLDASFGGLLLTGAILALTIAVLRRPRPPRSQPSAGPAR